MTISSFLGWVSFLSEPVMLLGLMVLGQGPLFNRETYLRQKQTPVPGLFSQGRELSHVVPPCFAARQTSWRDALKG
jgi:hypothetical protein